MKAEGIPYHLYWNAFENAKWILTDKNSGEVSEYNYSEMSRIVIDAYISHNSRLDAKSQKVAIRYLHQAELSNL